MQKNSTPSFMPPEIELAALGQINQPAGDVLVAGVQLEGNQAIELPAVGFVLPYLRSGFLLPV